MVNKKKFVSLKALSLVVLSGLCLGFSQPIMMPAFLSGPLETHGLLGLLSLIGYAPIIYLLKGSRIGEAFKIAFFASLIHFSITFYWLLIALTVFGGIPAALSVLILLVMAAVLSCYIGAAFAVAQFLNTRFGLSNLTVLPACVCAVEYMRNYGLLGGFPWGNIGYGITQVSIFLQSASLIGVYGIVFVLVFINSLLAELGHARFNIAKASRVHVLLFFAVLVAMISYGALRLSGGFDTSGNLLKVALLQGNIEQGIKNQSTLYSRDIIERYEKLQDDAVLQGAQLIVWPESAFPLSVSKKQEYFQGVKKGARATVLGAVVYGDSAFHNAAIVLDEESKMVSQYYKSHLVPFGEYVPWPFRSIASKVVPGLGAFMPGNEYKPTRVNIEDNFEVTLGMTICYEGVFPEISRTLVLNGANLLLNLTNDAWYGVSSAPFQHLHMYRLRAVETGVPVLRATNTGVSAWVDSFGFVHQPTALYEKELVIADVPVVKKTTLYMYLGDVVAQLSLIFVLFALVLGLVGKDVFVRRRDALEWVLGACGLAFVLWAGWHFSEARRALDESAITKQTFVSIFGLIVLVAAWSGRKVARRVLIIVSIVTIILSFLVGLAEGAEYFAMTVLSAIVLLVALFRAKAYQ